MSLIGAGPPAREPVWWVRPDLVEPPPDFRVVVDTREQLPLFEGEPWTVTGTLHTGDYSLLGHTARVVVERKSLSDLYGSVAQGRERFEREFERLALIPGAVLLIEGSYRDVIDPDPRELRSQMNPVSVEGTVISWCQRARVVPLFAGNRTLAKRLCFRWLALWFLEHGDEL